MKKFIISLLIIITIICFNKNKIIIPKESIRLRVIANSDSEYDQNIKMEVKNNLEKELSKIIINSQNIDDVRKKIEDNMNNINNIVNNTLISYNYNEKYDINYGMNYFPEKNFNNIKYKEGEYESLVVKLGRGEGNNWWCVLFPPFCLIEAENTDNIEYTWKIKEVINKYF